MPIEIRPHGHWIRERQRDPDSFPRGTRFRTVRSGKHELIIGVEPSGKTGLQSILHPTSEGLTLVRRSHRARAHLRHLRERRGSVRIGE